MNGKLSAPHTSAGKVFLFCAVSVAGNIAASILVSGVLRMPLYLDTVFTVAVTFAFGLPAGLLTGALLYPLTGILWKIFLPDGEGVFWAGNLFILCTVSEIFLIRFFRGGLQPRETLFLKDGSLSSLAGTAARLMVLVVLDCMVVSVIGGIVDFILYKLVPAPQVLYPEDIFKLGLIRNSVPLPAAAILSRIPINIVDRFIAVFSGYGLSLLYQKICAGRRAA